MATRAPSPAVMIVCTLTPPATPAAQMPGTVARPWASTATIVLMWGSVPSAVAAPAASANAALVPVVSTMEPAGDDWPSPRRAGGLGQRRRGAGGEQGGAGGEGVARRGARGERGGGALGGLGGAVRPGGPGVLGLLGAGGDGVRAADAVGEAQVVVDPRPPR